MPPQDFRLVETIATYPRTQIEIVDQTHKAHWTWNTKMAPVASKI